MSKIFEEYQNFTSGIQEPTLQNYQSTLKSGIEILKISSVEDEGLPVLKYIFQSYIDFNDLCYKIEQYICTNVHFRYYRYTRINREYKENFNLDFSKHELRSLLILIRCNYISQGAISRRSVELINAYEHIDQAKRKTSLKTLKNQFQDIPAKYIENRYKDNTYTINKSGELAKMINANLYLLSYNHTLFTQSKKQGRIYNAFTSLNRVYRENELAFQLAEYDIKSANPQIIDKIFNFNNWKNVYSKLMQAYEISRNEAKIKFNATLNNYKLSFSEAKEVYLKAGYSSKEAEQLAKFTAQSKKGEVFKAMAKEEGAIMSEFVNANFKKKPYIRLHDAIYFEPEFYLVENAIEIGIDFGKDLINKENLNLELKQNTYKTVLTTPKSSKFTFSKIFKSKKTLQYKGDNFSFYDIKFNQLSAIFNINKPIITNGEYRNPTEMEFMDRLQKLHKILYYLNESYEPFLECIEHLHNQEGISFNKNYIYEVASRWSFDINDALQYVKFRNWVYNGESISTKNFNEAYHKERKEFINLLNRRILKKDLKAVYTSLQQNKLHYIDKKKYYYANRYEVGEIINKVYDLIGVKKRNAINKFNGGGTKMDNLYKNSNIGCPKTFPPLSINKLAKELNNNKKLARKLINFQKNKKTILKSVYNAICNIEHLEDVSQLFKQPKKEETPAQKKITPAEAFNYPIKLNGGYFDTSLEYALDSGKDYFLEWSVNQTFKNLFNNAKGGFTSIYDSNKWKKKAMASNIYDNHKMEILGSLRSA